MRNDEIDWTKYTKKRMTKYANDYKMFKIKEFRDEIELTKIIKLIVKGRNMDGKTWIFTVVIKAWEDSLVFPSFPLCLFLHAQVGNIFLIISFHYEGWRECWWY